MRRSLSKLAFAFGKVETYAVRQENTVIDYR